MKPSQVATSLNYLVEKQRPVFLWGPPGVGKSEVVAQVARARNAELLDVRLALLDPVDLKGFPVPNHDTQQMNWLTPDFLPPMSVRNKPNKTHGILFLDELNSAAAAVQAAAYQLILDRRIGKYELPENWSIIAAGNRDGDRSVTHRMPAALANRLVHIDFEVSLDDWCGWAIDHGVQPEIIAFLRFKSNMLHNFDTKTVPRAFPSPRSWMFVNDLLKSTLPAEQEHKLIEGTIGDGPAAEFISFIRLIRDLPNVDEILLNPTKVKVPDSPATLYALTTSLAMRASRDNYDILMKYVERVPTEFQVVFVRDSVRRADEVSKAKSFVTWAVKHSDVLI